jgi:tRNA dimethylallyltransferase
MRTVLIAGPTGSGKSCLALALAERLGGAVINADSMQVYRDLCILTARPGPGDLARAPHRLFGFVDAAEAYSAGRYARDAAAAIAEVRGLGLTPILVGGTGLYLRALTEGLSPIPDVPAEIRRHWRAEVARLGPAAAHALLAARDPEMARRLGPTDPQRVARALEVLEATGRSLGDWQRLPGLPIVDAAGALRLVVSLPREEVYRRCEARLDAMIREGALAEARALAARRLPRDLPIMRAVGLRPLLLHLEGKSTLEAAVAAAKRETRHYVRRQMTWISRNMIAWKHIDNAKNFILDNIKFP